MKISYIIPHKDRTELFYKNLESLLSQTDPKFEIIVVDNSTESGWNLVKNLVLNFKEKGLDIKLFRVDPSKCKFSHDPKLYGGNYNPAVQQNIGVKLSSGDIIVLTSPEVINARTNVEQIRLQFLSQESKFLLGWIGDRTIQVINQSVLDMRGSGISLDLIMKLTRECSGYGTACLPESWKPVNYFLGAMRKVDFLRIGGIDERYMLGIAFDDDCFAARCEEAGFPAQFCKDFGGIHLSHSRSYQGDLTKSPNYAIFHYKRSPMVANKGHDWGSKKLILEKVL